MAAVVGGLGLAGETGLIWGLLRASVRECGGCRRVEAGVECLVLTVVLFRDDRLLFDHSLDLHKTEVCGRMGVDVGRGDTRTSVVVMKQMGFF